MRDPMYFENYGEPLDFEVADKGGEKVLVPNYMVNLLSAITVISTCAVVARVGVVSLRSPPGKVTYGTQAASTAGPPLLPGADDPLEGWVDDWRALMPSKRPIVCFLNRKGFLRAPPNTVTLRNFPGFHCNEVVYNGLTYDNRTFHLLADATDAAILRQLNRVRNSLFPHWKVIVNLFMDGVTAKSLHEPMLLDSLTAWLEQHRVHGINFEFDGDAFLGDLDSARDVVSFFAVAREDFRWANLSVSAMLPYGATALFLGQLSTLLDRVFIKTHGLLDEPSGTTMLAAPLDKAGLVHHTSNHHTIMNLLEDVDDHLTKRTCFTLSLAGIAFKLASPSQRGVGDPVVEGPLKKTSFSDLCAFVPDRIKKIEDDTAYTAEGDKWVTHEDQFTIFEKTAKVLRHWHFLCIGVVDVDMDDIRAECGREYPLLRRVYETSYILKYS